MAKFNIGTTSLTRRNGHNLESIDVLFVEVDEKTYNDFVFVHAIKTVVSTMFSRRVIILDSKI